MKLLCAVVFCTFSFCYLYFYQADILVVAQHLASGGETRYVPWVGAILITITLQLLQVGAYSLTGLDKRMHWLTYLPSLLVLTFVSDVSPQSTTSISLGYWPLAVVVVLVLFGLAAWMARKYQPLEPDVRYAGPSSQLVWINLLFMLAMMVGVGLLSNDDVPYHLRAKTEWLLTENRFEEAVQVAERSEHPDTSLTMLRAYALHRQNLLGERLFCHELSGDGRVLVPIESQSARNTLIMPMATVRNAALRNKDYVLCRKLMNRELRSFSTLLETYYPIDSHLPRHYREAWVLEKSLHGQAVPDSMMVGLEDFTDFRNFVSNGQGTAVPKAVKAKYGKTYWYYYFKRS